jgi:hypothetical protein
LLTVMNHGYSSVNENGQSMLGLPTQRCCLARQG